MNWLVIKMFKCLIKMEIAKTKSLFLYNSVQSGLIFSPNNVVVVAMWNIIALMISRAPSDSSSHFPTKSKHFRLTNPTYLSPGSFPFTKPLVRGSAKWKKKHFSNSKKYKSENTNKTKLFLYNRFSKFHRNWILLKYNIQIICKFF